MCGSEWNKPTELGNARTANKLLEPTHRETHASHSLYGMRHGKHSKSRENNIVVHYAPYVCRFGLFTLQMTRSELAADWVVVLAFKNASTRRYFKKISCCFFPRFCFYFKLCLMCHEIRGKPPFCLRLRSFSPPHRISQDAHKIESFYLKIMKNKIK